MNRRSFISRTSLVLGSIGVNEMFKLDLLNKMGELILPRAHGANRTTRILEITLRAGIPMTYFAGSSDFDSAPATFVNFHYAAGATAPVGNENPNTAMRVGKTGVNGADSPLLAHAANIAVTGSVRQNSGHTAMFDTRGAGMGPSPVVEMAKDNLTVAPISGVHWNAPQGSNSTNNLAGLPEVERVTSEATFLQLFSKPRLKLEAAEVNEVLAVAEKLSRRQALLLQDKLQNSLGQAKQQADAVALYSQDLSSLLAVNGMAGFNVNYTNAAINFAKTAIARTLKGMQNNLVGSAAVNISLGDQHSFQAIGQQMPFIRELHALLASTVAFMKATDDVSEPGKKLWDTTVIAITSEFTRGMVRPSTDNSDGRTQGFVLIGKNVKGGFYGGYDLSGTVGMPIGFDTQTGQRTAVGAMNLVPPATAYNTIRAAAGYSVLPTNKITAMVG